ncbi:hypothetical protein G9A89_000074 [Geosiphon pyriformis]|nr:hypothetical protein G9A89_000074 [Geosiphon pyriformis]
MPPQLPSKDTQKDKTHCDCSPQKNQAFVDAFKIPYKDPSNLVELFQEYINNILYGMLFQSSRYGKTRFIKQIVRKIPTSYVYLHHKESTGYSPTTSYTPEIFNALEKISDEEE